MNRILMALDFSENSPEVEKVGFELAEKMNASVILVTIVNKFIDYVPVDSGQVFTSQWDARRAAALTSLEKVRNEYPGMDIEVVSYIGDPKDDIINLSIQKNATFIVMGTHGRTGVSHFVTGSTAEYVIRHSIIPIVVVPINKQKH